MTVLGINMTDRVPSYDWSDCEPLRKFVPSAVANARKNWEDAMRVVDRICDYDGFVPEAAATIAHEEACRVEYSRLFNLWQVHYWDEVLPDELMRVDGDETPEE